MSAPTTGRVVYLAKPAAISVEQKDTGTVQANIQFRCHAYRNGSGWEPLDGTDQSVLLGWFNLIKKDGNANEINVNSLKAAFGWDGSSFSTLQDADYSDRECQIVVDDEAGQDGKVHRRVQYVNPKDYAGGSVEKADAKTIQSLDQKYGPMLRALAGAKAGGAKPPSGNGGTGSIGLQVAWGCFVGKCNDYARDNPSDAYDQARQKDTFKKIVNEICPGKDINALTPADWAVVKGRIEKDFMPGTAELCPF